MESVAFYSYKGGVGRSLLLVQTARFLALTGRKVVALDLDFEAPGLHYKTGVETKVETGAVRLLQRSLDGDLPTLDQVREATVEVPMPATHGGWLRLLAAGPAPTTEYWADLGRLHELLIASQDAGLLEAVLDLQARIEEAWSPDVLLVDARTGVTGLGGIATMALCDRVVLVTTRARESLDGIRAVAVSLRATPTLRGEERRLEYVVSRVQGTEAVDARELREMLGDYFELPQDRYDGGSERLLGTSPPSMAIYSWARKMFLGSGSTRDGDIENADRWSLPSPVEFEILRDPTDRSVAAMLDVAPRTRFYDQDLIVEWVRGAQLGFAANPSFGPEQARRIIDGLAAIEGIERAKEVVTACAENASSRRYWLPIADGHLDRLVQEGLCATLCWRVPPRAFIELSRGHERGPPPASYALRRLARFMGLDYDPDAAFPREASKPVGDDADVHSFVEAFLARERQLEWSTEPLPVPPPSEGFPPTSEPRSRSPGYHGHLGSYTPATGRIVLAAPTIEAAAESLGRAPRHVGSVTLLHLSVLGMLHNGIDLDGQRWDGFPTDELPSATIALAQFFVHRFLVELDDDHLLDAFEALTNAQPTEYGAWRAMTHISLEAGREWMMSIRRGTGGPAPIDLDSLLRPR